MPGRRVIRDAILDGVHTANVEYEEWSNGWWVTDSAVEGIVGASVARSLNGVLAEDESLAMELPIRDIQEWSEANRPRGRPRATLTGRKRVDIVILDRNERPICVVEVKRYWDRTTCFKDLKRIRDLILRCGEQHDGSLKRGFLAFTLVKKAQRNRTARERTTEHGNAIKRIVHEQFPLEGLTVRCETGKLRSFPRKYRDVWAEPNWAHAALCIELARTA